VVEFLSPSAPSAKSLKVQFLASQDLMSRSRNTRFKPILIRSAPQSHWLDKLDEQDILCAPVCDMREALSDPQTRENQMILEGPGEGRQLKLISNPVHLSPSPVSLRIP
jgi:crotonobetainyl-CoA:carnitine CoA-transferase CaiB-like acyl-CoA transferase